MRCRLPGRLWAAQEVGLGCRAPRTCVAGVGTDGRPTGLPSAKTGQDLVNKFLGQTMDANGNTPGALGLVMAAHGQCRRWSRWKLRGMLLKLLQAVADLYIVSNELAGLPEGDWAQQMINTLQPAHPHHH